MQALLDIEVLGNSTILWISAALAAVATWAVLGIVVRLVRGRLTRLAAQTRTRWDDLVVGALGKTRSVVLLIVSVWLGSAFLVLPQPAEIVLRRIAIIALLAQAGLWLSAALEEWLHGYGDQESDRGAATTVGAIGFIGKLGLWTVVLLVALDNLGIDVTALVAGLGVGGVAVALATQNILADLFASLSIVLDKPFVLGDFIVVGDLAGSIEHVGLKTTRVRSLGGEQLVFANSDLLGSRLHNFGRMRERRVVFSVGVTYQTSRAKLGVVPGIVREAVEAQTDTRFDRCHLAQFGDSALQFEAVYWVLSPSFDVYRERNQAIYLRICERFEQEGIDFAYPTQTLYLERGEKPSEAEMAEEEAASVVG